MATRSVTAAFNTAITDGVVYPAFFVEVAFTGGTTYVWSGIGNYTWGGNTYTGVGTLLDISLSPENTTQDPNNATLTLSGIPSSVVSAVLGQVQHLGTVSIYLGLFDTDGDLIQDPYKIFGGYTDVATLEESPTGARAVLTCESKLIQLTKIKERRYTDEDQKEMYPGDKGLEFVADLQDKQLHWGKGLLPSGGGASGGKYICGELYRQGYMPLDIYLADLAYMNTLDENVLKGYRVWSYKVSVWMAKSKLLTSIIKPFGLGWAQHMAYLMKASEKDSWIGRILHNYGVPLCRALGKLLK